MECEGFKDVKDKKRIGNGGFRKMGGNEEAQIRRLGNCRLKFARLGNGGGCTEK